jgi:tetratricopeptide (TPR) repeat protein
MVNPVSARDSITEEGARKAIVQLQTQAIRQTATTQDEANSPAESSTEAMAEGPEAGFVLSEAEAHVLSAIDHAEQNDVGSAISEANAALAADPGLAEAHLVRGLLHQESGNHEYAVNEFTLVTQIPPPSSEAYRLRGVSQANLGNYAEALSDLGKAIGIDPENVDAYFNRAVIYQFRLGQEGNALSDYNRVIELAPDALAALNNRAILLTLRGQHDAALADMAAYARYNDQVLPANVLDTRGFVHLQRGDFRAAIADYQAALDAGLSPIYPTLGLGIAYAELGDWEQAWPLLQQGLGYVQGLAGMDGQLRELVRRANTIVSAR